MANLYLIGMPGSGKTTLARLAAQELGMLSIDLDERIEEQEKSSISQLFNQRGEASFRELEAKTLEHYAGQNKLIVATGGGIILDPANVLLMQKSGLVVYIKRPLELILKDMKPACRPLLQGDPAARLSQLYAERQKLYEAACHVTLINDGDEARGTQELVRLARQYFKQKAL